MATDESAVELAPEGDEEDAETRLERARERIRSRLRRIPRPSPPSAQTALYAYTVALLLSGPALTVLGITWVALRYRSLPEAVAIGGLAGTAYALFLLALIVRYERSRAVEP